MPYRQFDNIETFNTWHENIMNELGIPDGLGTISYSEPIVHPENGTVCAIVDERGYKENDIVLDIDSLYELGYLKLPDTFLS